MSVTQEMNQKKKHSKREIEKLISAEIEKKTSYEKIQEKYGLNLKEIERIVTKIKGINISAEKGPKKIRTLEPKDFKKETTTVWSFRPRGSWATHSGEYRGNWSPYIPRNVILKYSKPGETVLDYFCGAGTTAVEAKLLGRKCIAIDINNIAIEYAKKNLDFKIEKSQLQIYDPELSVGNARDLRELDEKSVDLICAHPPYANIIQYSHDKEHDLSFLDIEEFLSEMKKVAEESFRVLKPGKQCAILIGDMRRKKHVVPLASRLIDVYLKAGFRLRELVIKRQHNCKTTGFWYNNSIKYNFLLLAHEYLPIFEKPKIASSFAAKEGKALYGAMTASQTKLAQKRGLKDFETTTVWIFPEKDFRERLNKNVINRYAGNAKKAIVYSLTRRKEEKKSVNDGQKKFLYIQSPLLDEHEPKLDIDAYLQQVRQQVQQHLREHKSLAYVAIQTRDVRINGYVEPLAKRIIDILDFDQLKIREIIVITTENQKDVEKSPDGYLKISHQYLLVYSVVK